MGKLTPQQANDLANQFLAMAQAIGDFRYKHWKTLSKSQHARLASQHCSILNYGEDILALSTALTIDDAEESLATLKAVVEKIRKSLKTLKGVQDGIDIAADLVTLGASIVSLNALSIGESIASLTKDFQS